MSQDTVDKKLKEWNEIWFGSNQKIDVKKATDNIPDFLKRESQSTDYVQSLKTNFTWIQDAVLFTCSVENAVTG